MKPQCYSFTIRIDGHAWSTKPEELQQALYDMLSLGKPGGTDVWVEVNPVPVDIPTPPDLVYLVTGEPA